MLIYMDYDIFGFLSDMGNPDAKLMFAVFVVFIIIAYKALGVLKNAVIVSVISACFPFVLDKVLGFDVDITIDLILSYVLLGVVLYLLYEVFKVIYKSSKVIVGIFNILVFPFVLLLKFLGWLFGFGSSKKTGKNHKEIVKEKEKEYKVIAEEKEEHKKGVEETKKEHDEITEEKKKNNHDKTVKEKKKNRETEHKKSIKVKKKKHDEEEE